MDDLVKKVNRRGIITDSSLYRAKATKEILMDARSVWRTHGRENWTTIFRRKYLNVLSHILRTRAKRFVFSSTSSTELAWEGISGSSIARPSSLNILQSQYHIEWTISARSICSIILPALYFLPDLKNQDTDHDTLAKESLKHNGLLIFNLQFILWGGSLIFDTKTWITHSDYVLYEKEGARIGLLIL